MRGNLLLGVRVEVLQGVAFVWSKSGLLLFSNLLRGDFRQLVRAGFADENSNFVICRLAAMRYGESLDCGVTLRAPHAVLSSNSFETPRISNP